MAKKINLREKWDVIIFAEESAEVIKSGRSGGSYPPEFEGGIGDAGVKAIKTIVEQGGVIIALNDAGRLFIKDFGAPARDVLEGVPESKFSCLKSLLKINVDNTSPIGYGLPDQAAAMFGGDSIGLAFEARLPAARDWEIEVAASYPDDNLLLRGGLSGEDFMARRSAVIDAKYIKGHLVLIGFPC